MSPTPPARRPGGRRPSAAVAALVLATALAACGDPQGPSEGQGPSAAPRLLLSVDAAPGDTAAQVAVGVSAVRSDSAALRELRVYVDSASRPTPVAADTARYTRRVLGAVAYLGGPGRHTVTVAVTDTTGRTLSARFTRTVTLDSVAYTAAALPDLGAGATPEFIHPGGAVAGAVTTADGRERPAVWRGGQLRVLPVTDSLDATARRVNAAGDVLLQYRPRGGADTAFASVRVLRADGALFTLGPWRWANLYPAHPMQCCSVAGDLNDARQAVASRLNVDSPLALGPASVVFDVAAGQVADTVPGTLAFVNGVGQIAGARGGTPYFGGIELVARGFTPAGRPAEAPASVCDWVGRYSTTVPLGLDDAANVLARWCGNPVLLSPGGSVWLDRYLGPKLTTLRLSQQGGVVAALDSASGTLLVWRADTRRAARVEIAGGRWRVVRLAGVTAAGAIAARAVEAGTGRAAALLLTPSR